MGLGIGDMVAIDIRLWTGNSGRYKVRGQWYGSVKGQW